ncbi:prokaryotic phospholipase A2 domain-containing protein [Hirsutella rhossiliensis]|uniref:Prokaryotic phospholipase a2 domain-containing protein n=1 Tax=Hirsutella rhossiliensis TaxID=111463 RepID=A0A9P8ML59_9HYPO|nr:prokaryotic phospholipase a2 domain-containing protein [Hirsutella rhossiliensis]KAH0957060.1 prokaryotic phospholipase a2 domain-containing protein [Hirsutella rhossiliensis]
MKASAIVFSVILPAAQARVRSSGKGNSMIEPDAKAPKPNTDRDEQAPEPNANTIKTITDQYVFELAMPDFLKKRDAKDPESLDWESDGCTYVFDNPLGFSFVNGCYRHDFAYRNYKAQDRFTETAKDIIDQKFLFEYVSL